MSRTTIAAVLAMLMVLAPAASARPMDAGYPAYPTPEVAPQQQKVMPERITDTYSTKGNHNVGGLVREQESTSGSGNQGGPRPADATTRALAQEQAYSTYGTPSSLPKQAPVPVADSDDGKPWPLFGAGFLGIALLVGAAVALVARPRKTRVAT
jgi:hypothetical protein